MTLAQQAELYRRLEHAVSILCDQFYGSVELRVERGQLRWVDVSQRLRKVE